jgi:hypothetical protein
MFSIFFQGSSLAVTDNEQVIVVQVIYSNGAGVQNVVQP